MARPVTLELAVWNAKAIPEGALTVTRFKLPHEAHDILAQWCRERTRRDYDQPITVILRGLSEIMAWFVPEVAFARHDWDPEVRRNRLTLYFVGDMTQYQELGTRIQTGIALWLSILYPDKPVEVRNTIASSALEPESWSLLEVGSNLKKDSGACVVPENRLMWDALAARAVAAIAGEALRFRSDESRKLVTNTAQSSAYEGIELVAFPPKHAANAEGLWSEVITVYTPSYPERAELHVLARPSIRNWGPVTRYASASDPNRSLDIFLPVDGDREGTKYKHTSFKYSPRLNKSAPPNQNGRLPVVAWWPHKEDERVFALIRRLSGNRAVEAGDLEAPVMNQEGLWILPRLWTGAGDKRMAGGSGLPWPDRKDIADSLDEAFADIGLERANPMVRVAIRMPLDGPFNATKIDPETHHPRRRRAVLNALRGAGNDTGELEFHVFHLLDRTPQFIADWLSEYLGKPASIDGTCLQWPDGLSIRLIPAPAGVLSELLPWVELAEAEKKGRTKSQQDAMIRAKRDDEVEAVTRRMARHVEKARSGAGTVACALLEMPSSTRKKTWGDPFQFARRTLAHGSVLPQVVLVDAENSDPEAEKNRYAAAGRDCFRMLGTLPVKGSEYGYAPAALTIIQRNRDRVAGRLRRAHAFPLAARVRDGELECAIPEESGEPVWLPYSEAALQILCGEYGKFGRSRRDENLAKFNAFFTTVLADIDRCGPALVIAEGETLGHTLSTLQNGKLEMDRLSIGNRTFAPEDLPNLRLVRVSPDSKKQPYYYHDTDVRWRSGLFSWDGAKRTFYGLKEKPPSVSTEQHYAASVSRHQVFGENENPPKDDVARVSAQMEEICVAFMQEDDDPKSLATLTHRLRGVHVQFRYDTSLPFPLHELRLLGDKVTL